MPVQSQVSGFNDSRWRPRTKDPSDMTELLSMVLNSLLSSLAEMNVTDNFITPFFPRGFVESFNLNERREWEDGVRMCITHRMYASCVFDHGHSETSARGNNFHRSSRLVRDHVRF